MLKLKNNEQCNICGRFANRGITIDAIIINDGKIFLIKRGSEPFKGSWALPGGYVEWNETVEEAVKREVIEETGLHVKSLKIIGVYSDPNRHPKQCIDVAYAAETDGKIKIGDDAVDFKWEELNNIPKLAFDHNNIIEDYFKNNFLKYEKFRT